MKIDKGMLLDAILAPIPRLLVKIPFQILGLFIVPFLYKYRDVDIAHMYVLHRWAKPWINPEDWTGGWRGFQPGDNCIPPNMQDEFQGFWGFYRYHALRNRAYGLRTWKFFSLRLEDGQIHYKASDGEGLQSYSDWFLFKEGLAKEGASYWYFAWQGKRIGFKYIRYFMFRGKLRYYQCKFGWRITPRDSLGRAANASSHRWKYGTTATIQPAQFGTAGSDYDK